MATEDFVYVDLRCPCGGVLGRERTNVKDKSTRTLRRHCGSCGKEVSFQIKAGQVRGTYAR